MRASVRPSSRDSRKGEKIPGDFFTLRAGSTVRAENLSDGSDGEGDEEGPVGQKDNSRCRYRAESPAPLGLCWLAGRTTAMKAS